MIFFMELFTVFYKFVRILTTIMIFYKQSPSGGIGRRNGLKIR